MMEFVVELMRERLSPPFVNHSPQRQAFASKILRFYHMPSCNIFAAQIC